MKTAISSFFLWGLLLSLAVAAADKDLPRVLVLGDRIQSRVLAAAAKELKGKARLEFPKMEANDTGSALARIDDLLGDTKWDLIYFNYGLGDLFYKDPRTTEIRAMSKYAGGVRVTPPAAYRDNLEALVRRLRKTGAKFLWASTTPLVNVNAFPGYLGNLYEAHSELEYNDIAATIMKKNGIPIFDMHAFVMSQFGPDEKHPGHESYQKALSGRRRGKDLKDFEKQQMHEPVVKAILRQLP